MKEKPILFSFHEAVPFEFIHEAFGTMRQTPQHTYLILTKRADRMAEVVSQIKKMETLGWANGFYSHCYFGLTVCNQEEADEKIPVFLQVPGKKLLSIEPMLGAINLKFHWLCKIITEKESGRPIQTKIIDAVILGGETGPGARPVHPNWVRSVRDQCAAAGVPFFFKGWGEWLCSANMVQGIHPDPGAYCWPWEESGDTTMMVRVGRKSAGRLLDGKTHDDLPWVNKL